MKFYASLLVLKVLTLVWRQAVSTLDFTECGGNPIDQVYIDGCENTPCPMKVGETYNVSIQPEFINPQVDNALVEVGILQYGAYFEQVSSCSNPCIYSCPLTTTLILPKFNMSFSVSSRMVSLTSILHINATYLNGNAAIASVCVKLDISVSNRNS